MEFRESLIKLGKEVKQIESTISEQELVSKIHTTGVLKALGYKKNGVDIREQEGSEGYRADIYCLNDVDEIIFILEAKKPSISQKLTDFKDVQLKEKYMIPLKSKLGILTNGIEFIFYELKGTTLVERFNISDLSLISEYDSKEIYNLIRKPEVEFTVYKTIVNYFSIPKTEQKMLKDSTALKDFNQIFELDINSKFGSLVVAILKLFESNLGTGSFLDSAFEFWKNSIKFGITPAKEATPKVWEEFLKILKGSETEKKLKFMFCLETALILISRLIMVKVCDDFNFPYISLLDEINKNLPHFKDQAPLFAFPIFLLNIFSDMSEKLVASIFEEDIYLWWRDFYDDLNQIYKKDKKRFCNEVIDEPLDDFGLEIEKILISLYRFNFENIEDILGDLYQSYFNDETRKALGEFYTQKEVVNRILDEIGYSKNIINKRILDPACGSGTFLVEAMRRYLKVVEPVAKEEGWNVVLDELCNKPKIIGFDINPFACLISQVRLMIELIPKYKLALDQDRYFLIRNIPVYMTDSLEIEKLQQKKQKQLFQIENSILFSITLPIVKKPKKESKKKKSKKKKELSFIRTDLAIPIWNKGELKKYINNLDDFFILISEMFVTIKKAAKYHKYKINFEEFKERLTELNFKDPIKIIDILEEYMNLIIQNITFLVKNYNDGRLIKSIETLYLAGILKNFLTYDYVIGNPPFVRVTRIPKEKRSYYLGNSPYTKIYETAIGRINLYILFLERSISSKIGFLKDDGKFGFILPTAFMVYEYGEMIRKVILRDTKILKMINLNLCSKSIFSQDVSTQILILARNTNNTKNENLRSSVIKRDEISILEKLTDDIREDDDAETFDIPISRFNNSPNQIFSPLFSDRNQHILSAMQTTLKLSSVAIIQQGIRIGGAKTRSLVLKDREDYIKMSDEAKGRFRRKIDAKEIEKFMINWEGTYLKYFPENVYEILYLPKSKKARIKKKRLFERNKLFFKNTAQKLTTAFDLRNSNLDENEQYFFPLNTLYCIIPRNYASLDDIYKDNTAESEELEEQEEESEEQEEKTFEEDTKLEEYEYTQTTNDLLKFLLAFLNSPLAEFWYRVMYWGLAIPGGGIKYREVIRDMPIKIPDEKNTKEMTIYGNIIKLVDEIIIQVNLKQKIDEFPLSYLSELEYFESDVIFHRFKRAYTNLNPQIEGNLPLVEIIFGKNDSLKSKEIDSKIKINYISRIIAGKKFKKDEEVLIKLPRKDKIIEDIFDRYQRDIKSIKDIQALHVQINDEFFKFYSLEDQKDYFMQFLRVYCPKVDWK